MPNPLSSERLFSILALSIRTSSLLLTELRTRHIHDLWSFIPFSTAEGKSSHIDFVPASRGGVNIESILYGGTNVVPDPSKGYKAA
jgi:hypothetical protein